MCQMTQMAAQAALYAAAGRVTARMVRIAGTASAGPHGAILAVLAASLTGIGQTGTGTASLIGTATGPATETAVVTETGMIARVCLTEIEMTATRD